MACKHHGPMSQITNHWAMTLTRFHSFKLLIYDEQIMRSLTPVASVINYINLQSLAEHTNINESSN